MNRREYFLRTGIYKVNHFGTLHLTYLVYSFRKFDIQYLSYIVMQFIGFGFDENQYLSE